MNKLLFCALVCLGVVAFVESEDIPAKMFGTHMLYCHNDGDTVHWYGPDGAEIKNDKDKYIIDAANNSLTVLKIGEADLGEYRCETLKENKTLEIFSAPYIKPLDKSVNLVQGDKLELTCNAWGNPSPKVTWIKNWEGENLELTTNDHVSLGSDGKLDNAQLNITEVTYDDYGFYTCNVTNVYGSFQSTTKVRVKDQLAPLWPFIGICIEVFVLILIIIIYEKRKSKQNYDEDAKDEGNNQTNSNDHPEKEKEKARLRK